MEARVLQALSGKPFGGRRLTRAAKGTRGSEADIVQQVVISGRLTKPAPDARILRPSSCHPLGCLIRLRPVASSAPQTPVNSPLCTSRKSVGLFYTARRAKSSWRPLQTTVRRISRRRPKSAECYRDGLDTPAQPSPRHPGLAEGRHRKPGTVQSRPEMCANLQRVVGLRSSLKGEFGKLPSAIEKQLMSRWYENGVASRV